MIAALGVAVALLLSLLAQVSLADSCDTHSNCTSCASDDACMWVLLYNCTERCIETSYSDPRGIKARNVIWRSAVHNETQCPHKEECEIMEGDVPNPSFETWLWIKFSKKESKRNNNAPGVTVHPPWVFSRTVAVKNCSIAPEPEGKTQCSKDSTGMGLDGDFFLYMGGSSNTPNILLNEARLDKNLKISQNATHLSFFYALPYYSKIFSGESPSPFIDRTALDVYIDEEHVLRMSNINLNKTMYQNSDAYYHPMNIDVSRFADGGYHSLTFYFTEGKKTDETSQVPQVMLIDYVQVIKSNLNGNTFDGWEGAPFSNAASCKTYCLGEYIGDGVCDMVCMTGECKNDGGDCGYETNLSTEALLGIVFGTIGLIGVIGVIVIIAFFVFAWKKKRVINSNIKESGSLEMQDIKPKKVKKDWGVSAKNITFGGKEADIGIALKDTLAITNRGSSRSFSIGLIDEERCYSDMKFKIEIKPREFQLDKNEEQTVTIFVKIFCTTTISEQIEIKTKESPDETEIINLVASGKKSTRLNPYDLIFGDVIGEGSFGIVYRGIYKNTFDVAVKKLRSADELTVADFHKEADILEKIESEYTVKFYGAVVTDDYYCFVTEFAPFKSLEEISVSSCISFPMRLRYLRDISCGMEYLHSINIVHRDLKPGNVLCFNTLDPMSSSPVCKISDFGGSKILHNTTNQNMTNGMGTFKYMAPEILNGGTHYGKSVDVFSFGVMIPEIITGNVPYEDKGLTYFKLTNFILEGGRPTIPESMPPVLKDLTTKCWSQDPSQRPSFAEVKNILESI